MKEKKVFISTTTFGEDDPSLLKKLKAKGTVCVMNPHCRRLNEAEIADILAKTDYVGLLAGLEPLTREVMVKAKALKVISRIGVGLDNVDFEAARELKIKVFNTPGVLTDSVAELSLGLMLSALRKITALDRKMHEGVWDKKMGTLLKGKTVGIVGFGDIGQQVAKLVMAFGAKVIFTDVRTVKKVDMVQVTFGRLVKSADIISFHCSGQDCLIGVKEIAAMKPGVMIINTARGTLIDETALVEGLSSGKVAGVGLDVFQEEPYKGPLLAQDNVVLTPHVGSYAKEARVMMEKLAVENLIKGLKV